MWLKFELPDSAFVPGLYRENVSVPDDGFCVTRRGGGVVLSNDDESFSLLIT